MKEPEKLPSLDALQDSIEQLKSKVHSKEVPKRQPMQAGLQIGLELAAGVLVGTGAGVLLDQAFGTTPLFLLVCMMFGMAGGMLTFRRSIKHLAESNPSDESDPT